MSQIAKGAPVSAFYLDLIARVDLNAARVRKPIEAAKDAVGCIVASLAGRAFFQGPGFDVEQTTGAPIVDAEAFDAGLFRAVRGSEVAFILRLQILERFDVFTGENGLLGK